MTRVLDEAEWMQYVEDVRIQIARELRIDEKRVRLQIENLSPHIIVRLRIDGRMPTEREKRIVGAFFASMGGRTVKKASRHPGQ